MSFHEVANALSQGVIFADGLVFGACIAVAAVGTLIAFNNTSSALRKINDAPSLGVSDLRSVISSPEYSDDSDKLGAGGGKFVVVRGVVEAKSAIDVLWKKSRTPKIPVSQETGQKCAVLKRTQTCIYREGRGFFGWTSGLRALLTKYWKQESSSTRMVPFVLVEEGKWTVPDYVIVDMDESRHAIPLTTVYRQLQPVKASPYTLLQALFGHNYPVGLLDEEKILPLGKDITAVGDCSIRNGHLEIKSCKDIPYYLSDLTKDQMLVDLEFKTKVLFWGGIALGAVSIGILGYSLVRNWNRWRAWRQTRERERAANNADSSNPEEEEENGDAPEGELCVICLRRRKQSAFIPCGHKVCCQRCAIMIERGLARICPVCRLIITGSVRIFES